MNSVHHSPMIARLAIAAVLGLCGWNVAHASTAVGQVTILRLDQSLKTTYTGCRIVKDQWAAGMPGASLHYSLCVANATTVPMTPSDVPAGNGVQFGSVWVGGEFLFQSTGCWKVGSSVEWDAGIGKDVFTATFACTDSVLRNGFEG